MKYFIGIDGGGTKTAFACMNEQDHVVYECTYESCHVLQVEFDQAVHTLQKGMAAICEQVKEVGPKNTTIVLGLAGYGKNQMLRQNIEAICAQSFSGYSYQIYSDADIALHGAFLGEDGILLIAGTGSIALGKIKDQRVRCGGWGGLLGDEGSAYWMAKRLLEVFTKQVDGRLKESELKSYVCTQLSLTDSYDVIAMLASPKYQSRHVFAKFALYVHELAKRNDLYALQIYEEAGRELAAMANCLSSHYDEKVKVSYAGGVWNSAHFLIDAFDRYRNEKIVLQAPNASPVLGACYLAKEIENRE